MRSKQYSLITHNSIDPNINAAVSAIDVLNRSYWETRDGNKYKRLDIYAGNIIDRITISIENLNRICKIKFYINHPFEPTIKHIEFDI